MEQIGTGAGKAVIYIQINSIWSKQFFFYDEDANGVQTEQSLSGATFEFFLKRNKGDRLKALSLTLGNGISFVTYYSNGIQVSITAAQSRLEEGEYYCELRRTDLDRAEISCSAWLTFDAQ